jgi:hypothetical protein
MTIYAKTSKPHLDRDMHTQAIINTNYTEYQAILDQRKRDNHIRNVEYEIDALKNEFQELKELLIKHLINGSV